MEKELGEIKAVLKKYGQEHLLNNFENLDEAHKKELLKDNLWKIPMWRAFVKLVHKLRK